MLACFSESRAGQGGGSRRAAAVRTAGAAALRTVQRACRTTQRRGLLVQGRKPTRRRRLARDGTASAPSSTSVSSSRPQLLGSELACLLLPAHARLLRAAQPPPGRREPGRRDPWSRARRFGLRFDGPQSTRLGRGARPSTSACANAVRGCAAAQSHEPSLIARVLTVRTPLGSFERWRACESALRAQPVGCTEA